MRGPDPSLLTCANIQMHVCKIKQVVVMAAGHAIQQLTVLLCHMYFKQNVSAKQSHVKILQLIIKGSTWVLKVCAKFKHLQVELKKVLFASLNRVFGLEKRD